MEGSQRKRADPWRFPETLALMLTEGQHRNFQQFLAEHPGCWRVVHDFDADGISSAALWALRQPGELQVVASRQAWPELGPAELVVVLDLACPHGGFPWTSSTLVIDHHAIPERLPANVMVINPRAYSTGNGPVPCTALLVAELTDPPPERRWIAAVGALSDLGDQAPFALLQEQVRLHGRRVLRQVSGLVNAPHRARAQPEVAVQALLEERTPKQFLRSTSNSLAYLRDCQERVQARVRQAQRQAATVYGPVALLELESDCNVQSILAQSWKNRLPGHWVVVANLHGGRVHISARCRADQELLSPLQSLGLPVQGHPSSAGAVISLERWQAFKEQLRATHPHQR